MAKLDILKPENIGENIGQKMTKSFSKDASFEIWDIKRNFINLRPEEFFIETRHF